MGISVTRSNEIRLLTFMFANNNNNKKKDDKKQKNIDIIVIK